MIYNLRLTLRVKLAKWRIDDPSVDIDNADWLLMVFDRNLKQWVYVGECNRPGEEHYVESIEVLDEDEE